MMDKKKALYIILNLENEWKAEILSRYPTIKLSQWRTYQIFQRLKELIEQEP